MTLHTDITDMMVGQYQNQINYVLCSQRWRSPIQSAKTRPGNDCGSDHELLIAKFRLKLKKVEKTTRSCRYDLNKIPYGYIVEVINRFKGLYLIDRLPEELWTEICNIVQEAAAKTIPKKKKCIFIGRTDAEAEIPYLGHLVGRVDPLEKTLMLGKIEGRRRRE